MKLGFIYIIRNDINNKVYVGKTLASQEKRFKEHRREYKKNRCESRPLYRAMNKYGIDHFDIFQLEECEDSIIDEREEFWIEYYDSYKKGYNATKGGDGKAYLDLPTREIIAIYLSGIPIKGIAQRFNCSDRSVRELLKKNKIAQRTIFDKSSCNKDRKRKVKQIDLQTGEAVKIYGSILEAEKSIHGQGKGHIVDVCKGRRSSAAGFGWAYI